jgi:''chromo'' (CHRromatin Organisation MOdifier) domain.
MTYDSSPVPVWLGPIALRRHVEECYNSICNSFARYDAEPLIPIIKELWPNLDPSKCGATVPEKLQSVTTRAKRRRTTEGDPLFRSRAKPNVLTNQGPRRLLSLGRRVVVESDSNSSDDPRATYSVRDILLEASDKKSSNIYMFCLWDGYDDADGSWVLEKDLDDNTKTWWAEERERRFPLCDYESIRPSMFITSRQLPELIIDDSSSLSSLSSSSDSGMMQLRAHSDKKSISSGASSQQSSGEDTSFDSTDCFEIDCILKERIVRGQKQYRVKWKGYPKKNAWWVADYMVNSSAKAAWEAQKNN